MATDIIFCLESKELPHLIFSFSQCAKIFLLLFFVLELAANYCNCFINLPVVGGMHNTSSKHHTRTAHNHALPAVVSVSMPPLMLS